MERFMLGKREMVLVAAVLLAGLMPEIGSETNLDAVKSRLRLVLEASCAP
jgi:hypothetical protein